MVLVLENGESFSINFPVDQIKANNKLFRRFGALINFLSSLIKKEHTGSTIPSFCSQIEMLKARILTRKKIPVWPNKFRFFPTFVRSDSLQIATKFKNIFIEEHNFFGRIFLRRFSFDSLHLFEFSTTFLRTVFVVRKKFSV